MALFITYYNIRTGIKELIVLITIAQVVNYGHAADK